MTIWFGYDLATVLNVESLAAIRFDLHLNLDYRGVFVALVQYGVSYHCQPIQFQLASSLDRPRRDHVRKSRYQ